MSTELPREVWEGLHGPDRENTLDQIVRFYGDDLVRGTALRFKTQLPSYIADEDLISYGWAGLLKAINRYDPDRGPFRSFASAYVYGAILDELRSQDWAPRGLRREQRLVRQATADLAGESPSLSDVAAKLGWEAARLESTMRQIANSHHQTLEGTELILDSEQDLEGTAQTDRLCLLFVETYDTFDEIAQLVLAKVYFFGETLTAVARETGLSLTLVRKVHMEAVAVLFERTKDALSP